MMYRLFLLGFACCTLMGCQGFGQGPQINSGSYDWTDQVRDFAWFPAARLGRRHPRRWRQFRRYAVARRESFWDYGNCKAQLNALRAFPCPGSTKLDYRRQLK